MKELSDLMLSEFQVKDIDLNNSQWHLDIPNEPGWYFIKTNTPNDVLVNLISPPSEYTNDDGDQKRCRNYNISSRVKSLSDSINVSGVVIGGENHRPVYSGMTKRLLNRAREHTYAHLGTAGLALANYPELRRYDWKFYYLTNSLQYLSNAHGRTMLKLGEQIWRANNGWPILCAE